MSNPKHNSASLVATITVAVAAMFLAAVIAYRFFVEPNPPAQSGMANAPAPTETSERKNRRVVEAVLGNVTDAECQQTRNDSQEPDHHVMASAIIDLRYELEKRAIDQSAAEFKKQMETQHSDFRQTVANIEAETKRKAAKILADGERQRREDQERFQAKLKKQIDEAKREQAALVKEQNDRTAS